MKMRVAVLSLVTLLCLVAPVMAGPIPVGTPSGAAYTTDSIGQFGYPGPDFWSSLHSSAPSSFDLSGSTGGPLLSGGLGSDRLTGGPLGPPEPKSTPEPSGLMVMFGSGLIGVLGLLRRKLRA